MSEDKELVTAQALAAALDLSVETIWRYTRENKIPYLEFGGKQYRYHLPDVIRALTAAVKEDTPGYKAEPRPFTYQDYLQLPEEPGYHFEVLDGVLVKEPSPNVMHQRVSRRLQRLLEDYFWQVDAEGELFDAPLDVTFRDITVVQPDLVYVSGADQGIVKDTRLDGPPTLLVEVLSPSSRRRDRLQKLRIYQEARIAHYWLVNPDEKTLECFSLGGDAYTLVASGMDEEVVEPPDFPGLSVPLKQLWQGR
jgi:Uma2 family endonuclease